MTQILLVLSALFLMGAQVSAAWKTARAVIQLNWCRLSRCYRGSAALGERGKYSHKNRRLAANCARCLILADSLYTSLCGIELLPHLSRDRFDIYCRLRDVLLQAARSRHDETQAQSPWFRLWQRYGVCCRPESRVIRLPELGRDRRIFSSPASALPYIAKAWNGRTVYWS